MILRAKHIAYVFFFMLFVILISCTGVKKGGAVDNNKVGIQVEEIQFPPQNILQLKSYYLSSPTHLDSMDILIGYNYRLHSLDYIDLRTKRITQTQLSSDGPDALTRLSGISHFYDVMYIPSVKMYARLHIDKLEFDANRDLEKLINDRDLYLMLFNEAFEVVCEVKLAKHRYSYYTGWNVLSDGIALFVDNALDEQNTTDDLRMDLVFPE